MGHIQTNDDGVTAIFATNVEGQDVAIYVSSGDPEVVVADSLGGWLTTNLQDVKDQVMDLATIVTVEGLTQQGFVRQVGGVKETVEELSALFRSANLHAPPVQRMGLFQSFEVVGAQPQFQV